MSKPVVLITSRNGSFAAKQLLAQGKHTLRLAAGTPSKLADLVEQGAAAMALDSKSAESMAQACEGGDMVFLILPPLVEVLEILMFRNFLQVATAKDCTIKHVVYLSAIDAVDRAQAGYEPDLVYFACGYVSREY